MEVRLLGPVQLFVDGRSVAVRAAKQRALLALLALHAGEVVAADRAVDEGQLCLPRHSSEKLSTKPLSSPTGAPGMVTWNTA